MDTAMVIPTVRPKNACAWIRHHTTSYTLATDGSFLQLERLDIYGEKMFIQVKIRLYLSIPRQGSTCSSLLNFVVRWH